MKFEAEQLDDRRWRLSVCGEQFIATPDVSRYGVALGVVDVHWGETMPPQPIRMDLVEPRNGRRNMPRGPLNAPATSAAPEPADLQAAVEALLLAGRSHCSIARELLQRAEIVVLDADDISERDRELVRSAIRTATGLVVGLPLVQRG